MQPDTWAINNPGEIADRIKGTKVSLIGEFSNTTCGWINDTAPDPTTVEGSTFRFSCATTENTIAVLIEDYGVMDMSYGNKKGGFIIMSIAEVNIFETRGKFDDRRQLNPVDFIMLRPGGEIVGNGQIISLKQLCPRYNYTNMGFLAVVRES